MFQFIASTATAACILWAVALQPAHASLVQPGTTLTPPNAGASLLSSATQVPDTLDFGAVVPSGAKLERTEAR